MPVLMLDNDKSKQGTLELLFQLKLAQLPEPVGEFVFHPDRRWRFDFCWPGKMVALEVEGGLFKRDKAHKCKVCGHTPGGRHITPQGMIDDMEKYNSATFLGWRLYRVTPQQISSGQALALIEKALK